MNKPLSVAEVDQQFVSAFPTLTKKAKLTRLAAVVRAAMHDISIAILSMKPSATAPRCLIRVRHSLLPPPIRSSGTPA